MDEPESNYILSSEGLKLYYIIRNVSNPKAVICILHGLGEHSGRYEHVMAYMADQNISSVAFDFRGHGSSDGKRGHIRSMDSLLDDVEEYLKFVRVNHLDIPMFLFGHSFGGCVALNYVLKKPILELQGFISSSPWLGLAFEPPTWKIKLGKTLAGLLPKFSLTNELDPSHLSRDQEVVDRYKSDNLVHSRITTRLFDEITKAGKYVSDNISKLKLNGLVYHGTDDQLISFSATKSVVGNSEKIEFHELVGVYHEPHNDLGKDEVMQLITSWINTNL